MANDYVYASGELLGSASGGGGGAWSALARGGSTQNLDFNGARMELDNAVHSNGVNINLDDNQIEIQNEGVYIIGAFYSSTGVDNQSFIRLDIEGISNPTTKSTVRRPSNIVDSEFFSFDIETAILADVSAGTNVYGFMDCQGSIEVRDRELYVVGWPDA